jgi:hypothetical protein
VTLTQTELEQRQAAALKHGATSPTEIAVKTTNVRRRFLTRKGLRVGDLDAVGVARLDGWARAQAKAELLDRYFAAHGLLDEQGAPRPAAAIYFTALNSTRLALNKLEDHLRTRVRTPTADLEAYLATTYSEESDGD